MSDTNSDKKNIVSRKDEGKRIIKKLGVVKGTSIAGVLAGAAVALCILLLPQEPARPLDAAALNQKTLTSAGESAIVRKPDEVSAAARGNITNTLARLPLSFEPNRGQCAPDVRFLTRAPSYLLQLTATEMRLIVKGASEHPGPARMAQLSENSTDETAETPKTRSHALKFTWLDANRNAEVAPESSLPGRVNYFKGSDSSKWYTNIPTFERVRYKEMYAGIDLVYYGNSRQLEYDLIVAPGADPTRARLTLEGAEVSLTDNGDLDLTLSDGRRLQLRALVAYQEHDGERLMVEAHYRISRHGDTSEIAFQLAAYDHERPLIIDPLVYSTFLGGSGEDRAFGIAVNAAGEAFVTGGTDDAVTNFPTTVGAFDTTHNGIGDVFVTRVNAEGSALVYSTFLGGSEDDRGDSIAVNSAGEAFVTGFAGSANFPTTVGAFDTTHNGSNVDAFVTRVNAAGNALVYSTFLGGSLSEIGYDIAVNSAGEAFVTGLTDSANFPTTVGAFDTTHNGNNGGGDAFVTRVNAEGSALVYSTFLGGTGEDRTSEIVVNAAGEAFVTGETGSANYPTTVGAFDTMYNGNVDAFVTRVNAAGSALVYSTFLGGSNGDSGFGIAVNSAGEAFVTGVTQSANFPTTVGAFDTTHNGGDDAFVTRINAAGNALVYSTLLGGSGHDLGFGIAVNSAGEAFVTGVTQSANFPTTVGAFDTTHNGGDDAFVTRINAAGNALVYSTFLGGSNGDSGFGIAVNSAGEAFVTGYTGSANYPTTVGAFDTTHYGGGDDAFVAKLATTPCVPPPPDMVAWWPLDEVSGATSFQDIIGGNNATPFASPVGAAQAPQSVPGVVSGAIHFPKFGNGLSGVRVAPQGALAAIGSAEFTIDAWVEFEPASADRLHFIVNKFDPQQNKGYALYVVSPGIEGNERLEFKWGDGAVASTVQTISTLAPSQWHHVGVTFARNVGGNPLDIRLYVNGSQQGQQTGGNPGLGSLVNFSFLEIGWQPGTIDEPISLDELEIFSRPLQLEEILAIFNASSGGKCKCAVNDPQPPTITCPPNQTAVTQVSCPPAGGAVVNFPAPPVSDNCSVSSVVCTPPSGSTFSVGTTTVTCTATDGSGNTATCSFTVAVFNARLQDDSNASNVVLFNTITGAYRLCCNGTTFTGTAMVSARGCTFALQHNPGDRRLAINVDFATKKGSASLQFPPGVSKCTIMDRDITNDTSTFP